MFKIKCGQCGKMLEIPEQHAGQAGKCNRCGGPIKVPPKKKSYTWLVVSAVVGYLAFAFATSGNNPSPPVASSPAPREAPAPKPSLTQAHIDAVRAALDEADIMAPDSIELTSTGYVAAKFTFPVYSNNGAEDLARRTVMLIRNTVYVMDGADKEWNYRVSFFGPPPGPDLVSVIGSARMSRGSIDWTPGKP